MGAIAFALQRHFLSLGFDRERVVANARLENGETLLFRGADEKGRTVVLVARPQAPGTRNSGAWQFAGVLVSYFENAASPDVYRP